MSLAPGNAKRSIVGYFTGDIPGQAFLQRFWDFSNIKTYPISHHMTTMSMFGGNLNYILRIYYWHKNTRFAVFYSCLGYRFWGTILWMYFFHGNIFSKNIYKYLSSINIFIQLFILPNYSHAFTQQHRNE